MPGKAENFDVLIIGAGAAGLFCAAEASKRGARVLVIDHTEKIGEKIRISGGGRCNFTNIHARPENFLSKNPKFCISALKSFTPRDFIKRVDAAAIAWHEKKLGQLFCDDSAQQIIDMLVGDCRETGAELRTGVKVRGVEKSADGFRVDIGDGVVNAKRLVIATGGKSVPKIGATGFGYQIAEQFGVGVIEPRPALVPLTFEGAVKDMTATLAGVSVDAAVTTERNTAASARPNKALVKPPQFRDGFLFTHRGLSGPSILQISSYWREGAAIIVNLAPDIDLYTGLRDKRASGGKTAFHTALGELLPRRLASRLCEMNGWRGNLADWSDAKLKGACDAIANWRVVPSGSEGYRTAEVTLGGVDTAMMDSKTMEIKSVPGLFFIGEVVDVTGWLGGYNFQWAWSSAFAAARAA